MTSTNTQSTPASAFDWAALAGRIGLAVIFLLAGYEKVVHTAGSVGYMKAYGMPAPDLLVWPAALVELLGGALLVLGFKSRWAAAALIVFTVAASFVFHAFWTLPDAQAAAQQVHFMKNLAIVGGLLTAIAHGPGRIAFDR